MHCQSGIRTVSTVQMSSRGLRSVACNLDTITRTSLIALGHVHVERHVMSWRMGNNNQLCGDLKPVGNNII